uniref:SHSP domain-containing protein n=1 Tax=Caenorhabditis tropicalis TaxID=1561998 RepID=A0A1I7TMB1_9PELO
MSLCPYSGRPMGLFRDFDDWPFYAQRMGMLNNFNNIVPQQSNEVENNANKFSVKLDVAAFKPEELKVNLEGHVLTIEGHHEVKTEHGFTKRSFTRQFTLPKEVDVAHVHTSLNKEGQLIIDCPKTGAGHSVRSLPIHMSGGRAVTQKPTEKPAEKH